MCRDPLQHIVTEQDLENYNSFLDSHTDIPASKLNNGIKIQSGITKQQIIIMLRDFMTKEGYLPAIVDIDMLTGLSKHRGIHMSRCLEVIYEHKDQYYESLNDFGRVLSYGLMKKQETTSCNIKINARIFPLHKTKQTGKDSFDRVDLHYRIQHSNTQKVEEWIGITLPVLTACPCTMAQLKYGIIPKIVEQGINLADANKLIKLGNFGTHTQRGFVTVETADKSNTIDYLGLYCAVDSSSNLLHELLKRPDEHDLVVRALNNPQFTEDLVRQVCNSIYEKYHSDVSGDTKISVSVVNHDSIHIHDVVANAELRLNEIKRL